MILKYLYIYNTYTFITKYVRYIFITVFFHLCYEGAVDLDTIRDINDRHGLEVQIMEFGQIPKQVFTLPHPKRLTSVPNLLYSETLLNTSPESITSGIVSYILFS